MFNTLILLSILANYYDIMFSIVYYQWSYLTGHFKKLYLQCFCKQYNFFFNYLNLILAKSIN